MNKLLFYLIIKLIVILTQFENYLSISHKNENGESDSTLSSSLNLLKNKRSVNESHGSHKPWPLTNEKRLIKDLLDNYQVKWGRPVNNMSEKVVVFFGINLVQLLDLDEKNQVLITNIYSLYKWVDRGLQWERSHYGGLDSVRLPVNRIWTPDIVLYNYADTRLEDKREALAVVHYDGTVKWRPPSILKSTCQIDIEKFPYDVQRCSMKFGSWTYDGDSIDIQFYDNRTGFSHDEYIPSNEWEIIDSPAVRNEKFYSCCKEPFPDLTFYLQIKRKGGFYNYILVLPCVLLSCLTMVLFWLPPESPAKMVLGMNIFTSFFVLLLLLSKNVPSAANRIPLIGGYYCLNMVMIATSTCACTVVVHIFFRGNGRIPYAIRVIFLEYLAKIYCMVPPATLPPTQIAKKREISQINQLSQQNQPLLPQPQQQQQIQQHQPVSITTSCTENNPIQSNGNLIHQINRIPPSNQLNTNNSSFKQIPNDKSNVKNSPLNNENKNITKSCAQLNNHFNQNNNLNLKDPIVNAHHNSNNSLHHSHQHHYHQQHNHHYSLPYHNQYNQHQHQQQQQQQQQMNNEFSLTLNLIENDIKEIRDYLRHTRKKLETTDAKTKQTNEWKQVALVLDRTLFFLYCIAIVVSLASLFPR